MMMTPEQDRWVRRMRLAFREMPSGLRLFLQQDTGSLSAHSEHEDRHLHLGIDSGEHGAAVAFAEVLP